MTESEKRDFPEVEFGGNLYLLIGETDGAIVTKHDYESGITNRAWWLDSDGRIWGLGKQTGTRKDLRFTGRRIEVGPKEGARATLLVSRFKRLVMKAVKESDGQG
jgi:hypothetical protein